MFFSKIYKSWKGIQEEKYKRILLGFDTDLLAKAFSGMVLDMGSGSGFFEKFLQKEGFNLSKWVCLDPDPDMLGRSGGFLCMLGSGNYLPFKAGGFDNLICLDSIHLIREDFFWVLKPGGFALVSLFYNPGNLEDRRKFLKERIGNMETVKEFQIEGRESEIFILARKR